MKKGFTLIELLAILIILSIIMTIAVVSFTGFLKSSKMKSFKNELKILNSKVDEYLAVNKKKIPKNIGDTIEITIDDLVEEELMKNFKSPFNNSQDCKGYFLVTKLEDDLDIVPHVNCNISNSEEDQLVLHYNFDDYQEPTENIDPSKWVGYDPYFTCHLIDSGVECLRHEGSTSPTLAIRNSDFTSIAKEGDVYTISGYLYLNGEPYKTNVVRLSSYHSTTIANHSREDGYFEYTQNFVLSQWIIHNNLTHPTQIGDVVTIKNLQVEFKPYATPYTKGIRLGTVYDKSLNNNHANLNLSDTPKWTFDEEKNSGVYEYDGTKKITVLHNNTLDIQESLTLFSWVKFNNLDYTNGTGKLLGIMGKGHPDSANPHSGWWLSYDNRTNFKGFNYTCFGNSTGGYGGGTNRFDTGTYQQTFNNDVWYNIVVTIENNEAKMYIDGNQHKNPKTLLNLQLSDITKNLYIGSVTNATAFFNGLIDDIRIYSRALSKDEINMLYELTMKEEI